jgi:hypothetical protein
MDPARRCVVTHYPILPGAFYRLRSVGFPACAALALATAGYDVIGWAVVL